MPVYLSCLLTYWMGRSLIIIFFGPQRAHRGYFFRFLANAELHLPIMCSLVRKSFCELLGLDANPMDGSFLIFVRQLVDKPPGHISPGEDFE